MNRKKVYGIARLIAAGVVMTLALTGCLLDTGEKDAEAFLQVSITPPARMIGVTEYDVDSLHMTVHDEWDMVWEMDWFVEDGPQVWTIPVWNTGEHWLMVEHHGWNGDDSFEAFEDSPFWITPGVITRITVTPGAIGVVEIVDGDGPPPPVCDPLIPLQDCGLVEGFWEGTVEMPDLEGGVVDRYMVMEFGPAGLATSWVHTLDMILVEEQTMTGQWTCNMGIVEGIWTEMLSGGVWVPLDWGPVEWHVGGTIEGGVWYAQSDFQGAPGGFPDGCADMYITLTRMP